MSDSVRPHRRQPARLPYPWDSPGKSTGVCHFLLQCMKVKSESEVAQSWLTLSDSMDCSLPGCSLHGIFQARVLEWVAIAFSEFLCYLDLKGSVCGLSCVWLFAGPGIVAHLCPRNLPDGILKWLAILIPVLRLLLGCNPYLGRQKRKPCCLPFYQYNQSNSGLI